MKMRGNKKLLFTREEAGRSDEVKIGIGVRKTGLFRTELGGTTVKVCD